MTLPGMPDIYQGAEVWDLSLMDPDNRRPVDYDLRRQALAKVMQALEQNRAGALAEMRRSWQDGQLKLAVTATLLAHRRTHPRLFAEGSYQGLKADGPSAEHICAYSREAEDDAVLVVAAQFPAMLEADPGLRDIALPMPASLAGSKVGVICSVGGSLSGKLRWKQRSRCCLWLYWCRDIARRRPVRKRPL